MDTQTKNAVLATLAQRMREQKDDILEANKRDVVACQKEDPALLDRLIVTEKKIQGMIDAVMHMIEIEDPESKIIYEHTPNNGLRIQNRQVPFGNILIIYESRPDATIEASIVAFKAGNHIFLKGGKEAKQTNLVLVSLWQDALKAHGQDASWVTYLNITREETQEMLQDNTHNLDLIIPRGGEGLIRFVQEQTRIPCIISGRGNNFLFVEKNADTKMATRIILNGKKRISVCNALDKVLIDMTLPNLDDYIRTLVHQLKQAEITVYGDGALVAIDDHITLASAEELLPQEFLAAKIFLHLVSSQEEGVSLINRYSGGHSASIVTKDTHAAAQFQQAVDCAAVYHNASTRFTDGGQVGFGSEIAISTQKLHCRGPVGVNQLVTNKWFIYGDGQIRE